jgi:plastocyanin
MVSISDFAFSPNSLTIRVGDTVEWMNTVSTNHTTTSDSGDPASWDSGPLGLNATYSVTFTKPGTYTYHCSIHPFMTGTITVT